MIDGLTGKVALVTGAGGGIGRAVVLELARRGMQVHLAGRTRRPLEVTRELLVSNAAGTMLEFDLTDPRSIDMAADAVTPIDVLVHCAGAYLAKALEECAGEEISHLFTVNVTGPARLTRRLLPGLQARGGQVVLINSSAIEYVRTGIEAYASTKFALAAFARHLRDEVSPEGVRVLSVYPGRTATPMQQRICASEGIPYVPEALIQPADVAAMIGASLALPRSAEVTDLHLRRAGPGIQAVNDANNSDKLG